MKITKRDFRKLNIGEQEFLIENTWCDICNKSDLGLNNPKEYEENGRVFISGDCRACGNKVVSEIIEKNVGKV